MRSTLTLALLAFSCSLSAQLQNGGFEDLSSSGMPTYWASAFDQVTMGDSVVVDSAKYLLNTNDPHTGLHAIELRNSYNFTQDQGSAGVWFASSTEEGYGGFAGTDIPVSDPPVALHFWAKHVPVEGDAGYAEVAVFNESYDEIGSGSLQIGSVGTWTSFEVPITYSSTDIAAFIRIRFTTIIPGGNAHLGTRMLIDDVSIDYVATGIAEENTTTLGLFPNPATEEVSVAGLTVGPLSTLRVLDASGRVATTGTLLNGRLPLSGLPSGPYLVQVEQSGVVYESRLMIVR